MLLRDILKASKRGRVMVPEDNNKFKKNTNEGVNPTEGGILKQLKSRAIKIILDVQNKGEGME